MLISAYACISNDITPFGKVFFQLGRNLVRRAWGGLDSERRKMITG